MKKTLNQIVVPVIWAEWTKHIVGRYYTPQIATELDPRLPAIYNLEHEELLTRAVMELADEVNWHTNSENRMIKTALFPDRQELILAWDGKSIPDDVLRKINLTYQEETGLSGAKVAGQIIRNLGGKVRIENCKDECYVARNVVELPLKAI